MAKKTINGMEEQIRADRYLGNVTMSGTSEVELTVGYSDDDLVLFDSVKLLVVPQASRLQMNIVAFCTQGKIQIDLNGSNIVFEANQIMACPSNVSFSNIMMSPDFEFKALFISDKMLQAILRTRMNSWMNLLYVRKSHVATLGAVEIGFLVRFYEMLKVTFDERDNNPYATEIIESLLRGGFLSLLGFLMTQLGEKFPPAGRKSTEMVFQQFLDLLSNQTVKHRTVEYYAKELCVTPKYLSAVCKTHSRKTANTWIRDYVLDDIRYYLLQTNMSIKQISTQLGFPNTSFFGRYVKEHFGKSPSLFRKGDR